MFIFEIKTEKENRDFRDTVGNSTTITTKMIGFNQGLPWQTIFRFFFGGKWGVL